MPIPEFVACIVSGFLLCYVLVIAIVNAIDNLFIGCLTIIYVETTAAEMYVFVLFFLFFADNLAPGCGRAVVGAHATL